MLNKKTIKFSKMTMSLISENIWVIKSVDVVRQYVVDFQYPKINSNKIDLKNKLIKFTPRLCVVERSIWYDKFSISTSSWAWIFSN
jgi:hypothetical protein